MMKGSRSSATTHKASSSAKKRKCIKKTSALTKMKSNSVSGISYSQREKIAMEKLASYLVECGGTKRQSDLFTCKLYLRPDNKKQCFRASFYSVENKRFKSMAHVARFLNLSARTVSLSPPSKKISGEKDMRLDPNKNDLMVGGRNDKKEIGEVGYKFRKQFGSMGWFTGTVIEIIPKSYLRRCVYTENGEFEDLRVVDLVKLAKLGKKSTVSSNQSPEKVMKKKNQASTINQTSPSLTKKRKRIVSTSATHEGIVATSERPTMRKTNKFRTKCGKKTGKHCTGRCRCKDCEGKEKGVYTNTSWVCSACTRDSGVDPKQWWLCSHEKRPECWIKHCRDTHATVDNADANVAGVVPLSSIPDTKEIGEVGYKFRKQFGSMGWFTGTVVEIIPKSYLRRCVYTEDGEFEDLRVVDLIQLAKLDKKRQNDCSVKVKQSPPTINHKASSSAKKKQCKMKSSKYSGISPSQQEKVAMATLASYLEECGGTERQCDQFTCKLYTRPGRKEKYKPIFYSAGNKRFESMASVARYLNLSVPSVSPHPPCKNISGDKKLNEPKMHLEASKKVIDTQKSRIKQVVMRDNDTKEIGEVGYKFRKQFGTMGWFTGTVIEIMPKKYLRRCVYTEDGQFEDLRVADLIQLAKLDKKGTVSSNQSPEKVLKKKNQASAINQTVTLLAKKRKRIINTLAPTRKKSIVVSGILTTQREKKAMEKLASYLVECTGTKRQSNLFKCKVTLRPCGRIDSVFFSAKNERFRSMAQVARYLKLSVAPIQREKIELEKLASYLVERGGTKRQSNLFKCKVTLRPCGRIDSVFFSAKNEAFRSKVQVARSLNLAAAPTKIKSNTLSQHTNARKNKKPNQPNCKGEEVELDGVNENEYNSLWNYYMEQSVRENEELLGSGIQLRRKVVCCNLLRSNNDVFRRGVHKKIMILHKEGGRKVDIIRILKLMKEADSGELSKPDLYKFMEEFDSRTVIDDEVEILDSPESSDYQHISSQNPKDNFELDDSDSVGQINSKDESMAVDIGESPQGSKKLINRCHQYQEETIDLTEDDDLDLNTTHPNSGDKKCTRKYIATVTNTGSMMGLIAKARVPVINTYTSLI